MVTPERVQEYKKVDQTKELLEETLRRLEEFCK